MQLKIHTDDYYGGSYSLCVKGWPLTPVSRTPTHNPVRSRIQTVKGHTAGHCGHPFDCRCRVWTVPSDATTPKVDGGDGGLTTGHITGQTQGFSFGVAAILNLSLIHI